MLLEILKKTVMLKYSMLDINRELIKWGEARYVIDVNYQK